MLERTLRFAFVAGFGVGGCGGSDPPSDETSTSSAGQESADGSSGADDGSTAPATKGADDSETTVGQTEGTSSADEDSTTDADGTSSSDSGGQAAPTWNSFAMAFFEAYCWECHGPGDTLRDYSVLTEVMEEANAIRCGTAPLSDPPMGCEGEPPAEQFPVGSNVPSADERSTLVEWIDAGLPED